jgi:hypothetical protein
MDYLDHLGRVVDKKERELQIKKLEIELGFKLPQTLRLFYLMYQVNDLGKFKMLGHLSLKLVVLIGNSLEPPALHISPLKELGYDPSGFFEFSDINLILRDFFNDDYAQFEEDFRSIGYTSWQFPILIGINSENSGKVYVYNMDKYELVYIAESIFDYLMAIELDFSNNYCLPEGKTMNDLYQNWGEDFWRLREGEKPLAQDVS